MGGVETALCAVVRRQYSTMSSIRPGPVRFRRKEKGEKKRKKKSQHVALCANVDFKSYARGVQRQTTFFFWPNMVALVIWPVIISCLNQIKIRKSGISILDFFYGSFFLNYISYLAVAVSDICWWKQ